MPPMSWENCMRLEGEQKAVWNWQRSVTGQLFLVF